ncbi:MAG: hypothetical protein O7I42_04675, partial [Alphaproteobacteria bacterium]|nr:hypothetical protein [Alphaproteobacteria bacterium]
MAVVETHTIRIQADVSQFEAALRRLEQKLEQSTRKMQGSMAGLADKLEQNFARVEIKLDILRENFQAIEAQANKAGNAIGRAIELAGELSGSKGVAVAGKAVGMLSLTSEFEEKLAEFFAKNPKELLARFGTLERRAGLLKSGPDEARAAKDIAAIRGDQQLIISAIELQANALRTKLRNLIGTDPEVKAKSTPQILAEADLQAVLKVLREIKELTNNPVLREQIETSPILVPSPQQSGAFEQRLTELSGLFDELIGKAETFGATLDRALDDATQRAPGADGFQPSGVGFGGSQGGGQFTLASFAGASPFGGAGRDGLDRGLADTGGRVEDLSAGFLELTQAAGGFEDQGGSLVELLARSNALFGEQSGLLGQLTAQAPVLGGELAALFEEGAEAGRVFAEVADAVGASLLDAFEGAIARGESLSDVLKGLAIDMAEIVLKSAGNALLGSILGG